MFRGAAPLPSSDRSSLNSPAGRRGARDVRIPPAADILTLEEAEGALHKGNGVDAGNGGGIRPRGIREGRRAVGDIKKTAAGTVLAAALLLFGFVGISAAVPVQLTDVATVGPNGAGLRGIATAMGEALSTKSMDSNGGRALTGLWGPIP
jgi:hypothetical protein